MIRTAIIFLALSLSACASDGWFLAHSTGLKAQKFTPCPSSPRCRSSDANSDDERHRIAPLRLTASADKAWPAAVKAANELPRSRVMELTPDYLHIEIDSPWHFYVDDLELHLRRRDNIIAIRSSGRIGWYDFDVNRDRIESIRRELAEQGLVAPATPPIE